MPSQPKDKVVEARLQTQHKLETMDRYWSTWCRILAQAPGPAFCTRHLWLVDAMAGAGLHESAGDPDGVVPGTPFQATLAVVAAQREFASVSVKVRSIDKDPAFAAQLERLLRVYRGEGPDKVDVAVFQDDWANVVPSITSEIASQPGHRHRSLWLLDPYGVEPLQRRIIETLPANAEVIVNFDENALRRHAGKELELLTKRIYGDDRWRAGIDQPLGTFAQIFADSFPRFTERHIYPLRASGSQERFFVHLATSDKAVGPFRRSVQAALKAGTVIAGPLQTVQQKHAAAAVLMERFAGQDLSIDEMHASGVGMPSPQLRAVCRAADDLGYGQWTAKTSRIVWFTKRAPEPGLDL